MEDLRFTKTLSDFARIENLEIFKYLIFDETSFPENRFIMTCLTKSEDLVGVFIGNLLNQN